MLWIFNRLERDCRRGRVSYKTYRKLIEAEIYDAASTMNWLHRHLRRLLTTMEPGKTLVIYRGKFEKLAVGSRLQYYEWVKSDFPNAYACFFERDSR